MLIKRWLVDGLLLGAILFLPWWLWLPLGLACFLWFANYYEGVILALAADLFYGSAGITVAGLPLPLTLAALLTLLLATPLRYRLWH